MLRQPPPFRSGPNELSGPSRFLATLLALVLLLLPLVALASELATGPVDVAAADEVVMPCHAASDMDSQAPKADCCDDFCANCGFCVPAAVILVNEPVARSGETNGIRRVSLVRHPFSGFTDSPYRPPAKTTA